MGVRFHCPNGHKLNVKAFLAGKRGICPHCQTRFIIPLKSGGQVTVVPGEKDQASAIDSPAAETPAAEASPAESMVIAPPEPIAAPPATEAQPAESLEHWYVRPAKGDVQYGPATTEMMLSWVEENRIAPDSWVWKTGWAQWKFGSEVLEDLQTKLPPKIPATTATQNAPEIQLEKHNSVDSVANKLKRKTPRTRRQRTQQITVFLGALVLLLGIVVVLVLMSQN